ncbi:glycosyltransferase [Flavobacterium piscinae]|uniref:Glycosyltransferase n=1 Tax=Flavobacterium piscinae TaxID=2506424 RepID=A0A4Q1KSJ5_9FLAO|nr:glycosyltransferase [Flavobacterium piscinae]RXR33071.1 glycosyltransferase [Flavobacterium piscinae]
MANKPKIGLVLANVPAYSETFFNSKIKGLQENGFDVILFSSSKSKVSHPTCKTIFAPNFDLRFSLIFEFIFIFINCLKNLKATYKLLKLNRKDGLSVKSSIKNIFINSHFLPYKLSWLHFGFGTMALQSENVAKAIGSKMAVSFRGFDLYIYPAKFPNCYQLLFSKNVIYHVLSDEMKNTLIEYGVSAESINKITPAINVDFFQPSIKYETKNSVFQFITIGRLHWKKGLEYTLEAFSILKKQNIPFHYTIIGEGIEREKLMFAVHQLNLHSNVTFVGKISHNDVKNILEKSDFYIQYSIQEGFCNAVLEAQAIGLLCIVSDADGLSENVLHEKTGWVVPKRNPPLLAERIVKTIALSEAEKIKIRENAMDRVKREFNLTKQMELFKAFYSF